MSKALSNSFIFAVSCVGLVVTLILTVMHFQPTVNIGCKAGPSGCHGVLDSQYGRVGPIPTSLIGFGMYALFLGLALNRRRLLKDLREEERARVAAYASLAEEEETTPGAEKEPPMAAASTLPARIRMLDTAIWGLALVGVATSWWLQYVALFVLRSFCPWCLTSALLVTLIFLFASRDYLLDGRPMNSEQKLLLGVSAFIFVLVTFMSIPTILMQLGPILFAPPPPKELDKEALFDRNMHLTGNPNSNVVVIEFADYMCPACRDASVAIREYMKKLPDKFRLAYRHFPLDREDHRWSRDAARAAEAAAKQDKFWEMHYYIFDHQDAMKEPGFTAANFTDFARAVGLNVEKFKKDFEDPKVLERVANDISAAHKVHVAMTPTLFVVNRNQIIRVEGQDDFKNILTNSEHPIWQQGSADSSGQTGQTALPEGHSPGDGHNH